MTDSITFPSASTESKLSACPATKVPQASDWIYQDFFNTMLHDTKEFHHDKKINQITDLMLPMHNHEKYTRHYTTFSEVLHMVVKPQHIWDDHLDYSICPASSSSTTSLPELDDNEEEEDDEDEEDQMVPNDYEMLNVSAPVLIESTISIATEVIREDKEVQEVVYNQALVKKRKSTSSFSSLKSFMNVFNNTISHKKSKLDHPPVVKSSSPKSRLSKKFLKYFKSRF